MHQSRDSDTNFTDVLGFGDEIPAIPGKLGVMTKLCFYGCGFLLW